MDQQPLLVTVRGLIERTYGMVSGLDDLALFLIGDRRFHDQFNTALDQVARVAAGVVATAAGCGAKTLVQETTEGVRLCVYYPDELIDNLERHPPQYGLDEQNVDAFATLVEELDHLLVLAERVRLRRPLSLFELELHANVTKYLVLSRFLVGRSGRLEESDRIWLVYHLFEKSRFSDGDPAVRLRYEDAARWAVRFLKALPALAVGSRLHSLRHFHRADSGGKLELISQLVC
jgi:hypothetical protein